jgi:hypothetical protein
MNKTESMFDTDDWEDFEKIFTSEEIATSELRVAIIGEETRAALGLKLDGSVFSTLADGATEKYAMTEPVEFRGECLVGRHGDKRVHRVK